MKTLGVAILVFAMASAAAPEELPAETALPSVALPPELDRVLRDYETAWRAKDAQALADLFTEDGFVLGNGRPPARGRVAIRNAYAGAGGPLHLHAFAFATDGDVGYIIGGYAPAPDTPDGGKFVLTLERASSVAG